MKAGVITFPGSNCDDDTYFALRSVCQWDVDRLWHKDTPDLKGYNLIVIPGGFSYGDYLRCGAVASLSPIMAKVIEYAKEGGLTLGICNGFQILCEAGLLPGALAKNKNINFICRDVHIKAETKDSPWTGTLNPDDVLTIPIAHGDGRYVVSESDYAELKDRGQILFTYCTTNGEHTDYSNPNGSSFAIAGVCNEQKNIFGMMPHPERASDLRSRNGMAIWRSIEQTASTS